MTENNCKGCYTFEKHYCLCTKYSEWCPCIICIIKMICTESCGERMDFRDRVEIEKRGF